MFWIRRYFVFDEELSSMIIIGNVVVIVDILLLIIFGLPIPSYLIMMTLAIPTGRLLWIVYDYWNTFYKIKEEKWSGKMKYVQLSSYNIPEWGNPCLILELFDPDSSKKYSIVFRKKIDTEKMSQRLLKRSLAHKQDDSSVENYIKALNEAIQK